MLHNHSTGLSPSRSQQFLKERDCRRAHSPTAPDTNMGIFAPKFHTHVIFARDELIDKNPDLVKRFLGAWFETIAWIKANKGKSVEIAGRALKLPPDIVSRTYDVEIAMMQDDGRFDPEAIKVIKSSLVDMHILDSEPIDTQMFTTKFVQ
jgi:NitT/TauT family transport system substrate-binding protein